MLLGGTGAGNETWLFGALTEADATVLGSSCSSGIGPTLTSSAPYFANSRFTLDLLDAPSLAPCLFGLSAGAASTRIGPCTLYLQPPLVAWVAVTNQSGFAQSPALTIPPDATLRRAALYGQAFVADLRGPVLGLSFSAWRRLVAGD